MSDPKIANVQTLIEIGIDLHAIDSRGDTPGDLFFDRNNQHLQWDTTAAIATFLIDHGANVAGKSGDPKLSQATNAGYWAISNVIAAILRQPMAPDVKRERCLEIDAGSADGIDSMKQRIYGAEDRRNGQSVPWRQLYDQARAVALAGGCKLPLSDAALVEAKL